MLQIESGSPSSGNRELDSYVDAVAGLKYAVLILALVALVLPGLITRRADYVALIVAASLISLAYIPTILYRRRAASVRALLLMLDGIVSSFALLIVLGLWSMARRRSFWPAANSS